MIHDLPEFSYSVASNPAIQQSSDLEVLFSGESQTKPQHRVGPKVYDYYLLHHIVSGKGTFTVAQQSYKLQAGDSFLIQPEQIIQYEADASEPWHYRWVAFHGEQSVKLLHDIGFNDRPPVLRVEDSEQIFAYMQHIQQAFHSRRASSSMQAIGYLYLILASYRDAIQQAIDILEPEQHVQHAVRQMIHYLTTQYAQPIRIEEMAESLGFNRAYLSRIFKQATQMSPVTFLLRVRIDKGRQLLRERQELTIEQIAASVGIQDALYFSRQFRRFYHMSPSAYRESVL